MVLRLTLMALLACFCLDHALAAPSRLIILRHGEKAGPYKLCGIGLTRAKALAGYYLGRGAKDSLFAGGAAPAAILSITLHTLELAAPAAETWDLPVTLYSVLPNKSADEDEQTAALNRRTQEAAADLMRNPAWQDKTVVMVWEHKHIANAKLEAAFKGEEVTLRQLLKLDTLQGVPESWPTGNYDYFWIIDYANGAPSSFRMVKQEFGASTEVPANDWGAPNGMKRKSGCDLKGADG